MREPGTPYAQTNPKLHILKYITLKIEVKGCNGAWGMVNKERIGKTNVLQALVSKVVNLRLRIHLDCRN